MIATIVAYACLLVVQAPGQGAPVQVDCSKSECALRIDVILEATHFRPTDDIVVTIDLTNSKDQPIVLIAPIGADVDVALLRDNGDRVALRTGGLYTMLNTREITRSDLITVFPGKSCRVTRVLRLRSYAIPGSGTYSISARYVAPRVGKLVPERPSIWAWEDGEPQSTPAVITIESVQAAAPSN